jgi:hypothetical protein
MKLSGGRRKWLLFLGIRKVCMYYMEVGGNVNSLLKDGSASGWMIPQAGSWFSSLLDGSP